MYTLLAQRVHTNKFSTTQTHSGLQCGLNRVHAVFLLAWSSVMLASYWLELSHAGFLLAVAQSLPANPLGLLISPCLTGLTQTLGVK